MTEYVCKFVQLNCQRSYGVMCEIGMVIRREKISIALLQEPYVCNGRVVGLPSDMRVFTCGTNPKVAVVVEDSKLNAMAVNECMNEFGLCVWVKGRSEEFYV